MDAELILKPGREKSLLRRHPWIFSGAIERMSGEPEPGATVRLMDSAGRCLALGAYSPKSQIRARVWSWNPDEVIGPDFFRERLKRASSLRQVFLASERGGCDAYRLVHAESDGLPGLVVDRYGSTLVAQFLSWGSERWKGILTDLLLQTGRVERIYERSDADVRSLEGLPPLHGPLHGGEPPERLQIQEDDLRFWVDIRAGHKTGFYLDQRENRRLVKVLASGKDVLDCFTYSGGFALSALKGGAQSVLAVDASQEALELARANLALNQFPAESISCEQEDVFRFLRELRDRRRSFDMVVLDPPKFAATASQAAKAARGYKDINLLAFKLLRPGGLLVTFSCSGGISAELFQKIVAGAALDAGIDGRILKQLHQGWDHPVSLHFPEGEYLKGLVIQK